MIQCPATSTSTKMAHIESAMRDTWTRTSSTTVMAAILLVMLLNGVNGEARLECFACGLPKIDPELDERGSYGHKLYNHSCPSELINSAMMSDVVDLDQEEIDLQNVRSTLNRSYIRVCPPGVKSCFAAHGSYDAHGKDDLVVRFLGCSETTRSLAHGCNTEPQIVDVPDKKNGRNLRIEIEVRLCFCSSSLCNHAHLADDDQSEQSEYNKADLETEWRQYVFILSLVFSLLKAKP